MSSQDIEECEVITHLLKRPQPSNKAKQSEVQIPSETQADTQAFPFKSLVPFWSTDFYFMISPILPKTTCTTPDLEDLGDIWEAFFFFHKSILFYAYQSSPLYLLVSILNKFDLSYEDINHANL